MISSLFRNVQAVPCRQLRRSHNVPIASTQSGIDLGVQVCLCVWVCVYVCLSVTYKKTMSQIISQNLGSRHHKGSWVVPVHKTLRQKQVSEDRIYCMNYELKICKCSVETQLYSNIFLLCIHWYFFLYQEKNHIVALFNCYQLCFCLKKCVSVYNVYMYIIQVYVFHIMETSQPQICNS